MIDYKLLEGLKEEVRQQIVDTKGEAEWHKLLAENTKKLIEFKDALEIVFGNKNDFRQEVLRAILDAEYLDDEEKLLNLAVMDSAIDVFEV